MTSQWAGGRGFKGRSAARGAQSRDTPPPRPPVINATSVIKRLPSLPRGRAAPVDTPTTPEGPAGRSCPLFSTIRCSISSPSPKKGEATAPVTKSCAKAPTFSDKKSCLCSKKSQVTMKVQSGCKSHIPGTLCCLTALKMVRAAQRALMGFEENSENKMQPKL